MDISAVRTFHVTCRFLLLERLAAPKPSFEFVRVRTIELKNDHFILPLTLYVQPFILT